MKFCNFFWLYTWVSDEAEAADAVIFVYLLETRVFFVCHFASYRKSLFQLSLWNKFWIFCKFLLIYSIFLLTLSFFSFLCNVVYSTQNLDYPHPLFASSHFFPVFFRGKNFVHFGKLSKWGKEMMFLSYFCQNFVHSF